MAGTPESFVKKKVRQYLSERGAYRFSPVQMGIGSPTLDDLCCIDGRFLGIEYKAPGKKLTPRQNLTMDQINEAGGAAIWGDNAESIIEQIQSEFPE